MAKTCINCGCVYDPHVSDALWEPEEFCSEECEEDYSEKENKTEKI